MITTQMRRLMDMCMERIASTSTATAPRALKSARMETFKIKRKTSKVTIMIVKINMENAHLQSCLSKRGRERRKRNLARH
jgi:hypothetical protein